MSSIRLRDRITSGFRLAIGIPLALFIVFAILGPLLIKITGVELSKAEYFIALAKVSAFMTIPGFIMGLFDASPGIEASSSRGTSRVSFPAKTLYCSSRAGASSSVDDSSDDDRYAEPSFATEEEQEYYDWWKAYYGA